MDINTLPSITTVEDNLLDGSLSRDGLADIMCDAQVEMTELQKRLADVKGYLYALGQLEKGF